MDFAVTLHCDDLFGPSVSLIIVSQSNQPPDKTSGREPLCNLSKETTLFM